MKKVLLGLVIAVMMTGNIKAEFWVKGLGSISCGTVIEQSNDPSYKVGIINWISGFVTGMNMPRNSFRGKGIDLEGMYYEVVRLCKEKPLSDLYKEVANMYWKLEDTE
tara:strand:+ start:168 stop:491 length:324 start_codon:yes stop_codon:yes gene_type:complete